MTTTIGGYLPHFPDNVIDDPPNQTLDQKWTDTVYNVNMVYYMDSYGKTDFH